MSPRTAGEWVLYLATLAALGLAWLDPTVLRPAPAIQYLVVWDISLSMATRDEGGRSRLDAAREQFRRILPHLPPSARLSLGGFVGRTVQIFLLSVPVQERPVIEDALGVLDVRNAWDVGSRIDEGLRDIAHQMMGSPLHPLTGPRPGQYVRVLPTPLNIFFFTDGGGEDVRRTLPEDLVAWLRQAARVTFIGVGRPWDSPVPDGDQGDCLRDRQGRCFTSRLNEENLRALADAVGGHYARLGTPRDLLELFRRQPLRSDPVPTRRSMGWAFALGALGLFMGRVLLVDGPPF